MTKEWCLKELKSKRLAYLKAYHYKNHEQKVLVEFEMNMLMEVLKSLEDEENYSLL